MANRHRSFEIENGHSLIYPIDIVSRLSVSKNPYPDITDESI
jgi:hypothetical protein